MNSLVLKSPAKLNLYLNVLRKRPDGYHDIETVFEKIALFDTITIRSKKRGVRITTDNPALPTGSKNLAYKAARAIFDKTGFKEGVWIAIKKNIPVAAGLGGGSSNAAAVLVGINRFFKLGLKKRELIEIGRALGADVPFFIYDYTFAVGRGIGDKLIHINSKNIMWHIIISFDFAVATKGVYGDLNLGLTPKPVDAKIVPRFIMKNDIENLGACLYNKLEEVVLSKFKIVGAVKNLLLKNGAYGALLSGSGPTIFGITKTREEAIAVKQRIAKDIRRGCKILIANTMA